MQGNGQRGPFSHVREWPPLDPPRERKGLCPLTPPLQTSSSKSCAACGIRCGVHGFAMSPCESPPIATAPYYREARVTFVWRQTACRMRHCFARRIDECPVRRELLRTSTRSAERHPQGVCRIRKAAEPPTAAQQRIIEAEANRLAVLTRLCRAQAFPLRRPKSHSSPELPIKSLSLGVPKGIFSFAKENIPFAPAARRRHIPPRRARKEVFAL